MAKSTISYMHTLIKYNGNTFTLKYLYKQLALALPEEVVDSLSKALLPVVLPVPLGALKPALLELRRRRVEHVKGPLLSGPLLSGPLLSEGRCQRRLLLRRHAERLLLTGRWRG